MSSHLEVVTQVPVAPGTGLPLLFDLARDVRTHVGSLPGSQEEVVGGVREGLLELGDEVAFRARHLLVWWRLRARITAMERPHRFVDEQVDGPFAAFRHEHLFEPHDGGVRMTDRVTFRAPFGPLGAAVARLGGAAYFRGLLVERGGHLAEQAAERAARAPG